MSARVLKSVPGKRKRRQYQSGAGILCQRRARAGHGFLEALGYSVLKAGTPGEALKTVAGHPGDIHLLLTDVVLPGMDGRQLAQRIRAVKPGVKVLFMSGYTADVIAQRGVLEENVAFIGKPFSRDDLAHKVQEVLNTPWTPGSVAATTPAADVAG